MTKLALILLLLALATHRAASAYVRSDIVGNRPGLPQQNSSLIQASTFDATLVNPWGLAFGPTTPAWIAANGASTLALISGSGSVSSLKVAVGTDTPTGLVFNPYTTDFTIPSGSSTSTSGSSMMNLTGGTPSLFITATEQGNIWAWGSTLSSLTSAVRVASSTSSVFKGLAIAANGTARFLCAADFANREVVVFDSAFRRINMTGRFVDPDIPADFSPFNVANILGDIFVAYARQNASSPGDEQVGAGQGFISVFDPSGRLVRRFASRDVLNAPWGMVLAPLSFGEFGGSVLVGNFGDGRIWAYNLATGQRSGQLRTTDNREIVAEGLWGMAFGNGAMNQPTNTLFFNAGINDEADGLFGRIAPAPSNNATTPASA